MRLAWRHLSHDRMRFVVTIIGIAFATFLMVFQGSLFTGFVRASSKVIEAADAGLWIVPRGVSCTGCCRFGAESAFLAERDERRRKVTRNDCARSSA